MTELRSNQLYDPSILLPSSYMDLRNRQEKSQGLSVLLSQAGDDLKIAMITDGNVLSFVLPETDAHNIILKDQIVDYMRTANEHEQGSIVVFYQNLCEDLAIYFNQVSHPCMCCFAGSRIRRKIEDHKSVLFDELDRK